MATATPAKPNPAAVRDAAVEQAITAAANKVRANDLLVGAAAAAVVALGYVTAVVLLDKFLNLPDWVRLLGLVGLVGGLAAVAYFLIVRPMQRRVNPRYVARKIEETLPDDGKNVLINWVDLQDEELPGSVKAAVGANAAAGVADADVDSATNSKPVVWLGGVAGALVITLAVLFLVFSGPQFLSLVQRAVVPFKPAEIASATTITIDEPEGGDATVTDGQPLAIAVTLNGRVPDPNGPDKARLLVRYSLDSEQVIELPLSRAGSSSEFRTDLGRGTILNGFWYRVAAGDARTPEYQVSVRTRPMLSEFRAFYDYPEYLKWPKEFEDGAKLRAIRGTTVTLVARANRSLQSATLTAATVDAGREIVRGEVSGDKQDVVRFKLKLRESGTYRIDFKPTGPEVSTATADYPIEVEADRKPEVAITAPTDDEIQLPLNGLLAVDGTARDDHGIAGIELRFKVVGNDAVVIQPKPFREGKPLVREKDNTLLTEVPDYKDSVKLDALKDAAGKPVKLTEKDVLEYWLAATDNCTEPKANVGESVRKKVRLVPAVQEPQKKQEQTATEQERKKDEQKTEAKRDERLKNETRPEDQKRDPNRQQQPPQQQEKPEGQNQDKDPTKTEGDPQPKPDTQPDGKKDGQPDGKKEGEPPSGQGGDTPPTDAERERRERELKDKIEQRKQQEKEQGGDARGDGDRSEGKETKPDTNTKPQDGKPGDGGAKGSAEEKAGPKPDDMNKPDGDPGKGKDGGKLTDPTRSETKDAPKPDAKGEDKPTGEQQKGAPKEGTEAGTSKESKEGTSPTPNDTKPQDTKPEKGQPEGTKPENKKQDGSASAGRGAEPPPQGDKPQQDPMQSGGGSEQPKPGDQKKVDPKDLGQSKPKGEPDRGRAKPEPKGGDDSQKSEAEKNAGGAKGDTAPKPGESKDAPKGNEKEPMKKGPPTDAGTEKQPPEKGTDGKNDAAQAKGGGKQPDKADKPMGTNDPKTPPEKDPTGTNQDKDEPGRAKPSDVSKQPKADTGKPNEKDPKGTDPTKTDNKTPPGTGTDAKKPEEKDPKNGGGTGEKLDTKEMEKAVKDLESKDPATKQAAQDKLDKAVGKENREQIEKMQKDLQSDNPATRDAAQKKLEDMANQAQKDQKGTGAPPQPKELTEQEKKELIEAAKDLDSPDPKTKKDAQEKLDKAMGKENREKLEQMQKDLKSNDKAKREAAEQKLQEMAKNAQQQQQQQAQQPKEFTESQKRELADAAQKLNSPDEAERKAAEKKLDDAIGKQSREELQQDLKDLQGNDPAKAEQARKKLEKQLEEARKAQKNGAGDQHNDNKLDELGGRNSKRPGQKEETNLENQLKNAELQLKDFNEVRGNKDFLKENNWTEEEYERFLKQKEEAVQKLRDQVAESRINPTPGSTAPPTVGRNAFDNKRVEGRGDADKLQGSGGPPTAPPGFEGAIKRFSSEASKEKK